LSIRYPATIRPASRFLLAFPPPACDTILAGTARPAPTPQFRGIRDLAFDSHHRLHVLEGRYHDGKRRQTGNCRIQVFDRAGKFLRQSWAAN
jgi:hypothetical protein